MAKKKYSPAQQRLGALDVNDDILVDKYDELQKKYKALSCKNREQKKEMEELEKSARPLRARNDRLKREVAELKMKLKKADVQDDEITDIKDYFFKYFKRGTGTQKQFNADMVRILGDKRSFSRLYSAATKDIGNPKPGSKAYADRIKNKLRQKPIIKIKNSLLAMSAKKRLMGLRD